MLEDAVSQNTIKENTARKIICSIEEIIFSLNKDDREIFIKRLFKRVLPFFHNYNNFNFVNMLPTYVSQVYTQKEERDNVWNLLKNIFLTTHCIKDLILSTIDICKDFGIEINSIINEIGIVDFDCFLLKENSLDRKSTRLYSSHRCTSRMRSSA